MLTASLKTAVAQNHTSEVLLPANTASSAIRFQNVSGSVLWLNSGAAASGGGGSYRLDPGDVIDESYLPVDADVTIYGQKGAVFTLKYR